MTPPTPQRRSTLSAAADAIRNGDNPLDPLWHFPRTTGDYRATAAALRVDLAAAADTAADPLTVTVPAAAVEAVIDAVDRLNRTQNPGAFAQAATDLTAAAARLQTGRSLEPTV